MFTHFNVSLKHFTDFANYSIKYQIFAILEHGWIGHPLRSNASNPTMLNWKAKSKDCVVADSERNPKVILNVAVKIVDRDSLSSMFNSGRLR